MGMFAFSVDSGETWFFKGKKHSWESKKPGEVGDEYVRTYVEDFCRMKRQRRMNDGI
jgi:hypothetical protein